MTNDERNTALAALIGAEGYEAAEECPNDHMFMDENLVREWPEVGQLCEVCVADHRPVGDTATEDVVCDWYIEASMHGSDPTWHPEWRVQPAPKDFTIPGELEPLARELLTRWHDQNSKYSWWYVLYSPFCEDLTPYTVVLFPLSAGSGSGETFEIALGEAMLDAARRLK